MATPVAPLIPVTPTLTVTETRKERRWQWYIGVGAVIALFSLFANVVLSFEIHSQQVANGNQGHQIVHLLQQNTAAYEAQKKASEQGDVFLGDLGLFATYIIGSNEAICAATHAACPPLPTIPKIPK